MNQEWKKNSDEPADVIVIGAGLCGSCVALELARQNLRVALIDQDSLPMNRASRRNEGKIHLGLIYAADQSFSTAELQLKGALSFYGFLKNWLGDSISSIEYSTPFSYLVAKDSIVLPDALGLHYEKLEKTYHRNLALKPDLDYMGTAPSYLARRIELDRLDARFHKEGLSAAFGTSELAIDTDGLADLVSKSVRTANNIQWNANFKVREIERVGDIYKVSGETPQGTKTLQARQVVNASWDGRLALDASFGLTYRTGWVYRLKYRILARLPGKPANAPSATMVLGPYGDVVVRPNGSLYLSWYPSGMQGWSSELAPPKHWGAICGGEPPQDASRIIEATLKGIVPWYPDIRHCVPYQVDAGVIVAYGETDVDDPASGLHKRTLVGVSSIDGYHSVDPGKLTTAPLFAMETAERVISAIAD